ncbi:SpoIIE family protein phosphatase [Amorphoplanes nipponensis]|uniref:Cyclic diguanylate phosphodiesterase n=1 Tax=Actinoplanes nipponensis TaxID=135950 RepID=A0A919JKE4_9ACTN|nr:GAF domain-containing SpoIIE family protein phosphatase [Actinoplanes nipponensis]GIE51293.1 cyclic diguanylate phosphodiesterase [Actinoplanes nipponensis]
MLGGEDIKDQERLRRLEAVTDTALSRMAVADLLDELLDRVRDLLQVDTATILLLDVHSRQLVVTAAKGLEEELRRGVRIPVGRGFAGRIAHLRQPIALTEVTAADVVSPILLQQGIRSLLGVPMVAGDDVVGVLHVGSRTRRVFTPDDVHLLQLVADRAALAGQIRATKLDQAAALALQRSLLPAQLPGVPGIDLAARYVPGHDFGIGGDWYDVFPLPSGWLGVVIGDVSGHGLASAVVMGRVRSALRAYALVCDDPAEALTLLDRKVHHFETGNLTTALYAVIAPDRSAVHVSLAGHLPPILAEPGRPAVVPRIPVGPPLGVGRPAPHRCTTILDFPPGAALVCYTDGLVEHRGEIIDVGIKRLTDTVRADSAEAVCAAIMAGVGTEQPTDDIALLTVHRQP